MARTFRLPKEEPLLNIASYARGGPRAADRLTPSQIERIRSAIPPRDGWAISAS